MFFKELNHQSGWIDIWDISGLIVPFTSNSESID